jgi:hypothetical protein
MIWTFFYGSWINLEILKEKNFSPEKYEIAKLHGYEIYIQPIANLTPNESSLVYGLLLATTREQHQRILTALSQGTMGNIYLPEAVLVETQEEKWKSAICYIADRTDTKPANSDYLDPFIKSARDLKFPDWYIKHLESFR